MHNDLPEGDPSPAALTHVIHSGITPRLSHTRNQDGSAMKYSLACTVACCTRSGMQVDQIAVSLRPILLGCNYIIISIFIRGVGQRYFSISACSLGPSMIQPKSIPFAARKLEAKIILAYTGRVSQPVHMVSVEASTKSDK
jgi:hypothetical protein